MVNRNLILAVCGALALTACSKEELLTEPAKLQTKTTAAVTVENGMLKFADEAAIESTLSMLLQKDEASLAAWYDSVGFVSQEMAREAALEEFRAMTSLDEYPAFKAKYQDRFLFNDNLAEEDYQPYVAASRFAYEMILNADGNAIVGGKVVNYNYDRFEQTMYYRVAHEAGATSGEVQPRITPETKTNQVYVQAGKKKFWAWAVRNGSEVYVQVTAQKKNMFGWNDYKADYSFRCRMRIGYDKPYTDLSSNPDASQSFFTIGLGQVKSTGRISCNSKLPLCIASHPEYKVTAAYEAWSSGTGEGTAQILAIQI
ncbi:DUF4848 domain-containing protein [uncultured Rikenella sp.]|uniref:DUF4848 domain-containing protein n=1 Tax=uncultured Rikenella sp. TaxID=368003 RepID=UPI00260859D1|nr:DUF4848 domain-containing protein [uncultured Rikenella sp.]